MNTGTFNVVEYGAVADGRTLNTKAIQAAVDACAKAGGGRVVVPAVRSGGSALHAETWFVSYA